MGWIGKLFARLKRDGLSTTAYDLLQPNRKRLQKAARKQAYEQMLSRESLQDRFREIYDKNLWSSRESASGKGSEARYTEPLRNWLVEHLPRYGVETVVDAPCGDFNWMKLVLRDLDVRYTGLDIVETVIARNKERFASERIQFGVANICEDRIPDCDLLLVRDCLFHLSFADIDRFLRNVSRTDYRFILTTTHLVDTGFVNADIMSGDYRRIDLFKTPFNFDDGKVLERVHDYIPGRTPREMVLIEKQNVPTALQS